MLFPWVGLLEQMRLADVFVHYDDVQFSKGSFTNRVQVKTAAGTCWMTVPLRQLKLGQSIDETLVQDSDNWRERHLALLSQSFRNAPYASDALSLAKEVYGESHATIGQLARASMLALARYFRLLEHKQFVDVRSLEIVGASSARVVSVVEAVGGTDYITGHGARNYLDHDLFERRNIDIRYMQYECRPYPQMWGDFTPYVTGLDLIANCGPDGYKWIASGAIPWRKFFARV